MADTKKKDPRKTIIAGAIAGAVDCCITMPLDTMGTQIQLQGYSGPVQVNHHRRFIRRRRISPVCLCMAGAAIRPQCARAIVKANGVKGLYAGFWPFLMQSSAKSSIRFFGCVLCRITAGHRPLLQTVECSALLVCFLTVVPGRTCRFELLSDLVGNAGYDQKHPVAALVCGMGAGTIEALCLTAPTGTLLASPTSCCTTTAYSQRWGLDCAWAIDTGVATSAGHVHRGLNSGIFAVLALQTG